MASISDVLMMSIELVNAGAKTRNLELLDRGLDILAEVELLSDPTRKAMLQGLLGEFLIQRWQISAVRSDLDIAIDLLIRSGGDTHDTESRQIAAKHLYDAAVALLRRFRRRRRIADIDNAILQLERAITLVTDQSTKGLTEMEHLLNSLREIRTNPPMMIVHADIAEADREDMPSSYSMMNMRAWNEGTPRFSGLNWVHSNEHSGQAREHGGTDLRVLFLCTFRDDDLNYVILNSLALAMEGGCGRIDIVSDLRDRQTMEHYWRRTFGDDRSLSERIDFTAAEKNTWRMQVLQRMEFADVILLHLSPKDINFPEFPFAQSSSEIRENFWDDFMDAPFVKPITGYGLLREVSYLNRMRRLPRTVIVCDERYQETFDDLIALGGIMGDATDLAGNFVTPRLTSLDKQVGYFRNAYQGITYHYSREGETVLPALANSIRKMLSNFRLNDDGAETVPWKPQDLCGRSTQPRYLPPDNQQKLISFTNVEDILFLPSGRITEIDRQDVLSVLNQDAIRTGCPYCHAPLDRLFFYIDGIQEPRWHKENHTTHLLRARCQVCGHKSSLWEDDMLAPQ